MLNLIFCVLTIMIFGKILKFAIKAAWSVSKIVCSIVLLPLFLFFLLFKGLVGIAFPLLIVIGIISLFSCRK